MERDDAVQARADQHAPGRILLQHARHVGRWLGAAGQLPELASRPLESESLWMRPSGEAAYTERRSGSATGS